MSPTAGTTAGTAAATADSPAVTAPPGAERPPPLPPAPGRPGGVRSGRLRGARTPLAVFAALLAAWWAVTAARLVEPLFLPGPAAVWAAFVRASTCHPVSAGATRIVCGEQGHFLWEHLLATLQRIGAGVLAAIVFGVALGFLMGTVRPLAVVLEPYVSFLRALPPLGYLGLLIVWFGIGDASKVWLLFIAAFPPVALATIAGVRGVRATRIDAARSLGASRLQVLRHVVAPSALPSVVEGVRVAVGFAWTTVVAAELNNGIPGIGGLAYIAGTQLQTPLSIACIIVIGLAAITLDAAIRAAGRLLVPWQGRA